MDVSEIHSTALEMLLDSRLELVFLPGGGRPRPGDPLAGSAL